MRTLTYLGLAMIVLALFALSFTTPQNPPAPEGNLPPSPTLTRTPTLTPTTTRTPTITPTPASGCVDYCVYLPSVLQEG